MTDQPTPPAPPVSSPGTQYPSLSTHHSSLPPWYPAWARELAEMYFAGTTCLFILNGNVHDLVPYREGSQERYGSLTEFLAGQVFGAWDVVLGYDLGQGLRPLAGADPGRLQKMMQYLTGRLGDPAQWPRDPERVLVLLDRLLERNLVEDKPNERRSIGLLFDYAQYLAPAGDVGTLARGQGMSLVRLLSWAQNPYIKRVNVAFCLVADKLTEGNHARPAGRPVQRPEPHQPQRHPGAGPSGRCGQ